MSPPDRIEAKETPAIFVHGAGGGAWQWRIWCRAFTRRGIAHHALDLEATTDGLTSTRFSDYQAQLREAVHETSQPPLLIGASLGGLLALSLARTEPLAGLVLINPLPPAGIVTRALPVKHYPDLVDWPGQLSLAHTRASMPDAKDAIARWTHRRWRQESGAVLNEAYAGIGVQKPGCPVLVLASGADTTVPPSCSEALARWASADVQVFPGASHVGALLGSAARDMIRATLEWLNA